MRIDEFSALPDSQITDTERTRFACFGFDIASDSPSTIEGIVVAVITGKVNQSTIVGKVNQSAVSGGFGYAEVSGRPE